MPQLDCMRVTLTGCTITSAIVPKPCSRRASPPSPNPSPAVSSAWPNRPRNTGAWSVKMTKLALALSRHARRVICR
eukprot:scaffold49771_cov65-Phaeocystis_antarctica.AAC.5